MKKSVLKLALMLAFSSLAGAEESRRLLLPLPHKSELRAMQFSPSRKRLASLDADGLIKVWNWDSRTVEMTFEPPAGYAPGSNWMAWLDEKTLIADTSDSEYRFFDLDSGTMVRRLTLKGKSPALLSSGELALITETGDWSAQTSNYQVEVFSLKDGSKARSFPIPGCENNNHRPTGMAASPDGRRLALGLDSNDRLANAGPDKALEINAQSGELIRSGDIKDDYPPESMAYSPSGQRIAAKCWGSSVFVWDQAGVRFVPNDRSGVVGTAWASEDELVYLVSNGGATLHKVKEPDLTVSPAKPIERAAYTCPPVISPEGQTVLSSYEGDLFDADSGKTLVKPADLSGVSSLVFHPSGRLLTGLEKGDVLIWDLGQGKLERRLTVPGQIRGLALSPDGQRLAVATNADNDVRLFDFKSGRQTGVLKTECVQGAGWAIAFNPAGDLLAVHQQRPPGWEDQLILYNVRTGEQVWKTEKTNAFAFHPREHKWAVLRKEGLVEIDLRSGQETLHKIKSLKDLAYDSKGDLFAVQCFRSGGGGNLLKMYPVSTGRLDEGQVIRNWPRFSADRLSYGARERCWWVHGDSGALYQLDENGKDLGHLPEATAGFGDFTWQSLPNGLLAVRSGKGTVDFWRGNQLAPEGQLVLLEGGKNWLCTSANGFFDGTDAAERLVEWQVGNKRYRVEQFFQQGYRPGLLREFYRGAKLSRTEGPLMSVMSPPKLEILSPAPGARLDNRDTEVRVRLVDQGDGCSNPKIFINGHAVAASQTRSESNDVYVFKTKLQPGVNEIRATGFDKSGRVESRGDKLRVTCTAEVRRKPQLWVLAVGVNKASSGRPLQFAEGDAQAIGAKLKSDLYESSQVTVLTGTNANKSKLDEAFREMEAKAEPQDTVVVFFAGHGVAESAGYRFLLAGKNPDLDALTSTELASYLESVPAHRQLVVLDTCHSAAASPELASRFAVTQQRMARGSGTFMLAACRSDETAAEIPSLKHGILTHSLLNGFGTKGASSNPQGQITVNSLIQFVSSDFPEVTRRFAQSQELYQFGNGSDFPLVKKGS